VIAVFNAVFRSTIPCFRPEIFAIKASGVARMLRALVQMHVMGPQVTKEIHLFLQLCAGRPGQWLPVSSRASNKIHTIQWQTIQCKWVYSNSHYS